MNKYLKLIVEMIELRDLYNYKHSLAVCNLSMEIASFLKLNKTDKQLLYEGSLLHDIGKVFIADDVLNKPGIIDPEERCIIQGHTIIGGNILKMAGFAEEIVEIVKYHHEWWNGQGYPYGLKGEQIPLLARIVSLADAYCAMTSSTIYAKAKTRKRALNEIKSLAGSQFAPEIVNALLSLNSNLNSKNLMK